MRPTVRHAERRQVPPVDGVTRKPEPRRDSLGRVRTLSGELGGVTFHRPFAFWIGVTAVIAGVLLHLPMYLHGRHNGYRLVGMPMDWSMTLGMVVIIAGMAASLYGLFPKGGGDGKRGGRSLRVAALDDAALSFAHVALLLSMAVAVMIDIMKPTSLAFVVPGMTAEYGLKSPLNPAGTIPAAYLALAGITGTVIGSMVWGWLGDKIGRRASILYAGISFIATSICGAMPDFYWNVAMCFLMGLGVGGMLPIAYTLLAETIPARHRGWLSVLIGADIAGAYILTSWIAAELVPVYSWRILWLVGLPTGVLFIMLNRWIPESPRYLLAHGRIDEAGAVMRRYGAAVVTQAQPDGQADHPVSRQWRRWSRAHLALTLVIASLGIGTGFILFGFNFWMPTNLRKLGLADADTILRNAALLGFPLTFVVSWLYGFWSSKKTIVLLAAITAAAMFGFVLAGDGIVDNRALLYGLLVVPIWGINSVTAVVSVYCSEIYPTRIRAKGSGFYAGACKAGGVGIICLVVFGIAPPSMAGIAIIGGISMTIALVAMVVFGVETRHRRLEDIEFHDGVKVGNAI